MSSQLPPLVMISYLRGSLRLPRPACSLSTQRMAFVTLAKRNMAAKYSLQSRHRMLSGHEIPVIGYGVSASANLNTDKGVVYSDFLASGFGNSGTRTNKSSL